MNRPPTNEDDPAFPLAQALTTRTGGLTKREQFAAMAMQGLIASCTQSYPDRAGTAAKAVEFADALIVTLNKPPKDRT